MVGVLALGVNELNAIAAAVKRARQHPIPWGTLKARAVGTPDPYLRLKDRKGGGRPESEHIALPFGYRLSISFEVQPAGMCQHISISSPDPVNNVPNEFAMAMIAKACGMQWPPGRFSRIWLEDFIAPGQMVGKAINLVEVVELMH